MGIFPPKVLFSQKKPLYQAKVRYLCSEKLSASGASPPDPLNRGSAFRPHRGNTPDPQQWHQSIGVHGVQTPPVFCRMVSKYMCKCAKSFSFWGTSSLRSPTGALPLDHDGGLPKFRSPSSPGCIKWQTGNESLCFSLRLCFSNNVFMVG